MRGAWKAAYDGSIFDYDGELYSVEALPALAPPAAGARADLPRGSAERDVRPRGRNRRRRPLQRSVDAALRARIRAAAHRPRGRPRGKGAGDVERAAAIAAAVSADRAEARRWARNHIAFYSVIPYFDVMFELHGFQREAAAIRAAAGAGNPGAMIEAVSDEMIDTFAVAGTPDDARAQLARWDDLDVAVPLPADVPARAGRDRRRTIAPWSRRSPPHEVGARAVVDQTPGRRTDEAASCRRGRRTARARRRPR